MSDRQLKLLDEPPSTAKFKYEAIRKQTTVDQNNRKLSMVESLFSQLELKAGSQKILLKILQSITFMISLIHTFVKIPSLIRKRSVFLSSWPGYLENCEFGIHTLTLTFSYLWKFCVPIDIIIDCKRKKLF